MLVFIGYALLITFVSLQPADGIHVGSYDKLAHLITYGVFAVLAYCMGLSHRRYLALCIGIILYGGLLEVAQSFVPGRDMSALDFLANTLGVIIGSRICAGAQ